RLSLGQHPSRPRHRGPGARHPGHRRPGLRDRRRRPDRRAAPHLDPSRRRPATRVAARLARRRRRRPPVPHRDPPPLRHQRARRLAPCRGTAHPPAPQDPPGSPRPLDPPPPPLPPLGLGPGQRLLTTPAPPLPPRSPPNLPRPAAGARLVIVGGGPAGPALRRALPTALFLGPRYASGMVLVCAPPAWCWSARLRHGAGLRAFGTVLVCAPSAWCWS